RGVEILEQIVRAQPGHACDLFDRDESRHDTAHRRVAQLGELRSRLDEHFLERLVTSEDIADTIARDDGPVAAARAHRGVPNVTRPSWLANSATPTTKSPAPVRTAVAEPAPMPAPSSAIANAIATSCTCATRAENVSATVGTRSFPMRPRYRAVQARSGTIL